MKISDAKLLVGVVAVLALGLGVATPAYAGSGTVTVILTDSSGGGLAGGLVQYYKGGWQDLGTTDGTGTAYGVVSLTSNTTDFQIRYAGGTKKWAGVNVTETPTLSISTIPVTVKLETCGGTPLVGEAKYYYGGWTTIGNTPATIELLPYSTLGPGQGSYDFQVVYGGRTSATIRQDVSVDAVVVFKTTKVTFCYSGSIWYYNGGWKQFTNGMELIGGAGKFADFKFSDIHNPTVRLDIEGCAINKTVLFVRLKDSKGKGVPGGKAYLGVGGWPYMGDTNASGELVYLRDGCLGNMQVRLSAPNNGGTQTSKSQDVKVNPYFDFQTSEITIQLLNSAGVLTNGGKVSINDGGWPIIGTTGDDGQGTIKHEHFLPYVRTFRMTYNYGTEEKSQDIGVNPVVVFQTAMVKLQFSGTIQHGVGGWPTYVNPTEMLPVEHRFAFSGCGYPRQELRFTPSAGTVFEKSIVFLSLKNSSGSGLAGGDFKYRFGWGSYTPIGTTGASGLIVYGIDGLHTNTKVHVTYNGASLEKEQNIAATSCVSFQTVPVTAVLNDSGGNPLAGGTFEYRYGWDAYQPFSSPMELLPVSTKIKVTYNGASVEKEQNAATNRNFVFQTVPVTAVLNDSGGNPLAGGTFEYRYGWDAYQPFSSPTELLPVSIKIKVSYAGTSVEKEQNAASKPDFVFQTGKVKSGSGTCTDYRYGWGAYIAFTDGMELLPAATKFKFNDGTPETSCNVVAGVVNNIH